MIGGVHCASKPSERNINYSACSNGPTRNLPPVKAGHQTLRFVQSVVLPILLVKSIPRNWNPCLRPRPLARELLTVIKHVQHDPIAASSLRRHHLRRPPTSGFVHLETAR